MRTLKAALAVTAMLVAGGAWLQNHTGATQSAVAAADAGPEAAAAVDRMLGQLTVVDKLPELSGYQRGCKKSQDLLTELTVRFGQVGAGLS